MFSHDVDEQIVKIRGWLKNRDTIGKLSSQENAKSIDSEKSMPRYISIGLMRSRFKLSKGRECS